MYSHLFELQAELMKALAHPHRLEIIQMLRDSELMVSEMFTMLDLPQAQLSQHLMVLREAKAVSTRRDGKHIYYQVADRRILKASDLLRELLIDQYEGSETAAQLALSMKELLPIVRDPVCGMRLSPATASFHHNHKGVTHYFCASGCLKKFTHKTEAYV
jgi:DNA-binding transcriptional ArsR family regulator/YHS domain-containing protein